jgi:lipoyl-dependent peroxiredoxin
MALAARKMAIAVAVDIAIDAEVGLCLTENGHFLQARLDASLPGSRREAAQALADARTRRAHIPKPY